MYANVAAGSRVVKNVTVGAQHCRCEMWRLEMSNTSAHLSNIWK